VALSTEDAPELAEQGCGVEHCHELLIRLSTRLLNAQQRVAVSLSGEELGVTYGGPDGRQLSLRSSDLLERLTQVLKNWYSDLKEETATEPSRSHDSLPQHNVNEETTWPAVHYFPWPFYRCLKSEEQAKFVGLCQLNKVKPSDFSEQELLRITPVLQADEPLKQHANALRDLRKLSAKECDLRVVWGGALAGDRGWWPRLLEEVYWTLEYGRDRSQHTPTIPADDHPVHRKPLLILGGFGGAAHLLAKYLQKPDAPWPTELKRLDVPERDRLLTELDRDSQDKLMDHCRALFEEFRNELWGIRIAKGGRGGARRGRPAGRGGLPKTIRGIRRDLFMEALQETSLRKAISLVMAVVNELRAFQPPTTSDHADAGQ
jgi:hypothetical protein